MFELSLELSPIKTVNERSATSFLLIGSMCVGVALFVYWGFEILFETLMLTQGDRIIQSLLWSLYHIRN